MNSKFSFLSLMIVAMLLLTQATHADFHKALDAYIARDGQTLLKEVKHAVAAKNDDGLMLFLMATNFDAATSDYDEITKQTKTTLREILPPPKWDEMRELLEQATNNTVDSQYALVTSSFGKDIVEESLKAAQIKRGVPPQSTYSLQEINEGYEVVKKELRAKGLTTSEADMMTRAEAGDAAAQLTLGLMYSRYTGYYDYACDSSPNHPACKVLNEVKGLEWLKKAALSYERQGLPAHETSGYFAAMCDFYQRKPNATPSDLKQAYLWCEGAFSLGSPDVFGLLNKLRQSDKLKLNESQIAAILTPKNKITAWPEIMEEAREAVAHEDLPVFSYEFKDETVYRLDIYSDGRVVLNPQQFSKRNALLMKVDSKKINDFIKALNQIGFNEWPLFTGGIMCDMGCGATWSSAMLRLNNTPHRVSISSMRMELTSAHKSPIMIRQAKLKVLVDTYFPTQWLRVELGNSEKIKQQLLAREKEWIELSKTGELK